MPYRTYNEYSLLCSKQLSVFLFIKGDLKAVGRVYKQYYQWISNQSLSYKTSTYIHTHSTSQLRINKKGGEVFVFLIDEIQSIYPVLYKSHSLQSCRYLCLAHHIVVVLKNVILFLMLASAMMMHANKHLNR